jgi:hypothetical protein
MQPRESQLHLRLDTDGTLHPAARRVPGHILEQGRLAHACLAVYHQCAALTSMLDRFDQLVKHSAFGVAAGQPRRVPPHRYASGPFIDPR